MLEYEEEEYIMPLQGGRVSLDDYTIPAAKLFFWQSVQQRVWADIRRKQDQGWEPIGEVGPSGITLRTWSESFSAWSGLHWILYIAGGLASFGLGFLVIPLIWKYNFAGPVDFRVRLRRRK
jgi:hypothetical protein